MITQKFDTIQHKQTIKLLYFSWIAMFFPGKLKQITVLYKIINDYKQTGERESTSFWKDL